MCVNMKNTKAELFAEVQRLTAELSLAYEISIKDNAKLERVKYELASLKVSRAPDPLVTKVDSNVVATKLITKAMPQWQRDRASAMAAAREMAMRGGSVVKV